MKIKLKQAFDLQMGKTPARNQAENWGGNHRWVSIADIGNAEKYIAKTKECITDAGINASGIKVVPQGTVIMSFKLSIGKTAITAQDMYTNEAIIAFIDKKIFEIDPNYLYHLCCGTDWTAGTNKAVMGLTLNKATLLEKEISLPDICQQRKIAAKLDKIDAIIADRQQQLTMIEQAVKSRFIELFVETDEASEWSYHTIADVSNDMRTGPFGSALHHDEFVDSGVFVLGIDNAVENKFSYNRMRYITEEKYQQLKRYTVYPGDVIITIMGTVGRSAVIPADMPKAINTKHLACITPNVEMVNAQFLSCAFQIHPNIRTQLEKQCKGAIMAGLNLTIIKGLSFRIPPITLQNQFLEFYEQTNKSKYYSQKFLTLCRSAANIYEQEWMKCQTLNF